MNQAPSSVLVSYPEQAAFGRTLPKSKIYEHSGANTRLKDLFVKQVEQIVWQYKLAPETINLPARPGVPEIQIFRLQLKTPELHRDVLRCIDGAVQFPILFELTFGERTQVVAAYKRPSEAASDRWTISDYFASGWLSADLPRAPMPIALNLGRLYEQLLTPLIPLPARPRESLADLVERTGKVQAMRREVDKTVARLEKERQFNRKVEINAAVRELRHQLRLLETNE